ncbi:MAG: AAA family ATPase [Lachnospiraceae bacterium]|nr:AAA family ATPase [Lachnospiraceae bacterium]
MKITKGRLPGAKKIIVYGPEGIGKTTFASQFPDPLFIDTEGSTKDMDVARFDKATSWAMVLQQVKYVINHPDVCGTLVIDTADWAEQLEISSLCAEKGWDGLEAPGYGKGYTYSAEKFGELLNLLEDVTEKGIHVVITAHAQLRKVELPEEMGAYDHWEMKTSKKVAPMLREWGDAVFFANYKTRIIEVNKKKKAQGGQRIMYTNHTPFWDAKNRYGLPEEMPFEYNSIRHIIERNADVSPQVSKLPEKPREEPVPVAPPKKEEVPEPVPLKSTKEPAKETAPEEPAAVKEKEPPKGIVEPDKRIPKALRDLMITDSVDEWDLQRVVESRQGGVYPPDTPVWNYDDEFIHGWILKFWDQIVTMAREAKGKDEIPFN